MGLKLRILRDWSSFFLFMWNWIVSTAGSIELDSIAALLHREMQAACQCQGLQLQLRPQTDVTPSAQCEDPDSHRLAFIHLVRGVAMMGAHSPSLRCVWLRCTPSAGSRPRSRASAGSWWISGSTRLPSLRIWAAARRSQSLPLAPNISPLVTRAQAMSATSWRQACCVLMRLLSN